MTYPDKLNLQSLNIPDEKREELLRIFPEVRTEGGQINFDRLRLALGDMVDTGKERYGLNWPGKSACFKAIQTPSMGTLLPAPEESVNFDTTENLIIEGDNLEALKLLQKSYIGKVKMIYIDPPYNTGNDFIYPDNYSESLQTYLEYTGQTGEEGKRFSSNTDTDGRFHSKWLNMMYPRLYLARDLLRDDGVIFISIGDAELANLRLLCDTIFGEENFISFVSRMMKSGGAKGNFFTPNIDYILCYAKNILSAKHFRGSLTADQIGNYYNKKETFGERRGEIYGEERLYKASLDARPNQRYWIVCPDGSFVIPPGTTFPHASHGEKVTPAGDDGVWKWTFETYERERLKGNIIFKETATSALLDQNKKPAIWNIYNKLWLSDQQEKGVVPSNFIGKHENRQSAAELAVVDIPFDFAKPSSLLRYLFEISLSDNNDIIVDFFAGSGTLGHAVLSQNAIDGKTRRFILVQLPEPLDRSIPEQKASAEFCDQLRVPSSIAEITKERVRRVIKKLNDEDGNEKNQDRGFRVFKLAESNFTPWNGFIDQSPEALSRQMEMHIEHVRQGRTDEDILYEILLKSGFPLSIPVSTLQVDGKTLYSIHDGIMLVCLDRNLTMPLVQAIVDRLPERIVFLDEGFAGNDALKVNAKEACKLKNIVFKVV